MYFEKVVALIVNQLRVRPEMVTLNSRLLEDLKADSANVMMLIMDIEQEFSLVVDDDMLPNIKTVGDIVNYLEKNAK